MLTPAPGARVDIREHYARCDGVLLAVLDRLVEAEGIVEPGERLGVNSRTADPCLDEWYVSRRIRHQLEKHLPDQPEQDDQATSAVPDEQKVGRGPAYRNPGRTGGGRSTSCGSNWRCCENGWRRLRVEF